MSPTRSLLTLRETQLLLDEVLYSEVVKYVAQRNQVTIPVADRQLVECLRYLYLISTFREQLSGLFLPVEQSIDEVWHYLILQTQEYRELCEVRLPGGFFIEHRSLPYESYGQAPPREQLIEESLRWLPLYRNTFGPFDSEALMYWSMPHFLHAEMGMSLIDIAALGEDAPGS